MMTKRDRDGYLQKLLELRSRLTGEVLHLSSEAFRSDAGDSRQPTHFAELGTDAHEQEVTIQMLQSEESALGEINAAIHRLQKGTYGQCDACGQAIPKLRLNVIPYARYCVPCQRKIEEES